MTVPSNLVPTSITQLPVAPNPTSSATMVCVIGGITYQVPFIDLQSTVSVPASREINTGGGLQGGGDLSQDRTLSIATGGVTSDKLAVSGVTAGTYGSGTTIPVLTVSDKGLVTSATEVALVISGYVPDTREIIAGAGLTGGGNLQANRTLAVDFYGTTPAALGTASAGSSDQLARGDHVHPALNLASSTQLTGVLPITHGGTGTNITNLTAGAIWYSDGTNPFLETVQGSSGQVLVSNGASAPSWGSALIVSDQPANYVYAGPTSGPDAPTAFRALVNADIPSTLTGKTMSGALNTFSSIGNTSLTNHSVTFNGVTVDLGASGTITAATDQALTVGTGLQLNSGTTFDGSAAKTISIDSTVATLTGGQTLTNKTMSGSSNTFSNIGNSSLTNSSLTIGTTSISLGGTSLTLGGLTSVTVTQDPTTDLQLATKGYVDSVAQGLNVKTACLWATTGNITLSGLSTQAGGEWTGSLTAGDRILVKNQLAAADNGIYAASSSGWTRTADANSWSELVSAFVFIQDGATLADTGWVCTVNPGGTLGVTAVTWTQFSGAGTYTAGTGLTLTGTQFSITNTTVTAAAYGAANKTLTATVNAQGQLTALADTSIAITNSQVSGSAASGANSDITSMSGLTGGIASPEYIDFDTVNSVTRATGRLWWDATDGIQTLNLGMAGSNATMQIGEELYYRVKASSAITEGQVVMFTGTVGASGALTAAPATGLTASTASYIMGVATESIALNGWGYITSFGLVRGIDTTGGAESWTNGQILYYDPSVTGGLTKTPPSAPNAKVQVAAVVYASGGGAGSLFVRPTYGGSLGQYEGDVQITTPASGDLLIYNGTNWANTGTISGGTY